MFPNPEMAHVPVGPAEPSSKDLPFVLVNMALSADGKIATANRLVSTFGSRDDQNQLYRLRAGVDAIVCGARTLDSGPVVLDSGTQSHRRLRRKRGLREHALRVLVSGTGSINPKAEVFRHRFSPLIALTSSRISPTRRARLRKLTDILYVDEGHEIDFKQAFRWLKSNHGVNRLLCEGGAELNNTLFRAGLVNELHLTLCPLIVGGNSAPTLAEGTRSGSEGHAPRLKLKSRRRVGQEQFLVYSVS